MTEYVTSHITALFGVAPQTVRNWATEFARYLSGSAAPGRGRNRMFNEDDMRVFALVAAMKKGGATNEEVHVSLASGQRGALPDIDPSEIQTLVMSNHATAVHSMKQEIMRVETERDTALAELQKSRDENNQLHGNLKAVTDLLTGQLNAALERVEKLNRKIWELESRIGDD